MRLGAGHILTGMASAFALAVLVVSCTAKLKQAEALNIAETPIQTVDDMFAVQTRNGTVLMRIEAKKMERYDKDTVAYESFPMGFAVYGYTEEGLLETIIISDNARHITGKKRNRSGLKPEVWEAFGNVVVHNVVKQETMETDTLYWDQAANEIYTDCYVKMYSPDGFMQGYGMRSDDHARNAILHKPFNGYAIVTKDSTKVVIDSVNFIGPLLKN